MCALQGHCQAARKAATRGELKAKARAAAMRPEMAISQQGLNLCTLLSKCFFFSILLAARINHSLFKPARNCSCVRVRRAEDACCSEPNGRALNTVQISLSAVLINFQLQHGDPSGSQSRNNEKINK